MPSKISLTGQPRWVVLLAGVVSLAVSYGAVSVAIDTGSWWAYLVCFFTFGLAVRWILKAIKGNG
jgi:hypothetical protein